MLIDLSKNQSQFKTKEKLMRLIWNIIWLIFKNLPRNCNLLRIFVLKIFGAKIGDKCLISKGVTIWIPWNLYLSDHVAIGRNVEIYNYDKVIIERMTVVSQYCYLCTGTHNYSHSHFPLTWAPITIGSEVWIAAGSWILPGVSIGNGAVIGARSLVSKNMPEWYVCAGNPCFPIKPRHIS
jgi:putative colanic acid biosynthesis acetyltransferase WcaF